MCGDKSSNARILGTRLNGSQGMRPTNKIGISITIVKCKKCQLVYANPQPIPESIQDHYGVPPEEYWDDSYFEIWDRYFKHEIAIFNSLHKSKENTKIKALDIGAGIGKTMTVMEDAGFDVYGIEPSEPFYDRALSKMNINPDRIQNASVETAQFDNETFDFITFGAVLEHLYDPSFCISQAMKWLKPEGILHIHVPSSSWLTNSLVNLVYKAQGLNYVANISPMHNPYHLYEFEKESFRLNGEKEGYHVVKCNYLVSDTYLPKILDFILKPYMRLTNKGMLIEVYLKKTV